MATLGYSSEAFSDSLLALSLLLPELSETCSCSQLEGLCLLGSSDVKGVMETALRFDLIV
jgi:hypothetical protein